MAWFCPHRLPADSAQNTPWYHPTDVHPERRTPRASRPRSPPAPPAPETYSVGVTDYTFNSINAIFGRLLKTPNGHVVTLAYWQQRETVSQDEIPYYEHK